MGGPTVSLPSLLSVTTHYVYFAFTSGCYVRIRRRLSNQTAFFLSLPPPPPPVVNTSYSPYNGDAGVHSPLAFGPFATCELLLLLLTMPSCLVPRCGVCGLDKYYVGQKPYAKLEPPDS